MEKEGFLNKNPSFSIQFLVIFISNDVSLTENADKVWYDASRKRPVLDTPTSGLQATTLRVVPAATMVSESESDPSHCTEGVIFLCVQTLHDRMFGESPSER